MPLEIATTIKDLNAAYPLGTDSVTTADDHIRLIKQTLKATFPNVAGPITSTLADVDARSVPTGLIAMWSGLASAIPAGWFLCDGQHNTPDLRDRFIVGAGSNYAVGATGGTVNAVTAAGGTHSHTTNAGGAVTPTGSVAGTALTVAQIPSHQHNSGFGESDNNKARYGIAGSPIGIGAGSSDNDNFDFLTSSTGGGQAHSHGLTMDALPTHVHTIDASGAHTHTVDTRSPYLALCFIMKG